ncbi:MAG: DUF5565 family protein [Flavobacterium sp.]|uniref:RNA ligase 1 family protein n=1 Tax=Flavobacterium sp. TaxID=239 RepID=UPI00262150F1|nr:DUF5565 family protein [Flavobacterium sp.]MDD5149802.1 DUF5565 family protein [Flavobacterium sp.]
MKILLFHLVNYIYEKISTLFVVLHQGNKSNITPKVRQENEWVYLEKGVKATRKFDGTACAIISGKLYKRYDCKVGKIPPEDAIPCQEPDPITGHWPHWVKCKQDSPADQYFIEGLWRFMSLNDVIEDGTYELCGPKVGGNPERLPYHILIKHGYEILYIVDFSYSSIKHYLSDLSNDIEGIVFHGSDGKMCKIRKKDFNIKRKYDVK